MFFTRRRPSVIFLYSKQFQHAGSTVMRGRQLAQLFTHYYGKQFDVQYRLYNTKYRNSTLILTKGVCSIITPEDMQALTARGNKLLLDLIDVEIPEEKATLSDGIIVASQQALEAYQKAGFATFLVNHHVDPRLLREPTKLQKARIGYFGELVNTIHTDKIARKVDFHQIDTYRQTNDWFDKPAQYNVHYAVRADKVTGFKPSLKPFLKGFTAAACRANIIIQKDQKEALHWLGTDYPYLLPANPAEDQILEMCDRVAKSFGSSEWKQALETMERIRTQTTDHAIADELHRVIQAVTDA